VPDVFGIDSGDQGRRGALSKTGAAISYGVANGTAVKIAAGTDKAAYSGR
jgi:hypothetical protein